MKALKINKTLIFNKKRTHLEKSEKKHQNINKKNYHLLDYLLPSEDLDDLNKLQSIINSIEAYDFANLIKKYDLKDN